jgi:ABC-type phosphate transport system permease subunit
MLLVIDFLGELFLRNLLYTYEVLGDLLLIETAALFLMAGIVDFGSSLGFVQFRRTMSSSKESFSLTSSERKDSEKRALVFVFSGATLFLILVLLAILRR